ASRGYGLSLVEIDKESPLYDDPYYERVQADAERSVTLIDKTISVKYNKTTQYPGKELKDTYKDENGNTYNFAEDGTFLSYRSKSDNLDFSSALYIDKGISPELTEDQAISLAERIGKEIYGDVFDKLKFESISYYGGIYDVFFYQKLGADQSILGLYCNISILADGRVSGFSMPNLADLRELDESKYENVTKEDIAEEIAVNASKVFGEKKVDFPLNDIIHLYKINGKYVLHAMTESRSGGADIYYEVTDQDK
ncbi:MAG: hypothetical protein IJ457_06835, partial [Clostridia bacterium]|nr:hypothetical protein [Clostridia bacterium]